VAKNTIKIKKYLDIVEEYVAVAAITPGHLVEVTNAGKVQKHSTQDGNAIPMFALENELEGEGITTAYAADDPVQVWIPQRGEQVYALLANGENASIGDLLTSNGDGTLKVLDTPSAGDVNFLQVVAMALEAVDMSGSSAADPSGRIEVMII
jgi:hypothetical protein